MTCEQIVKECKDELIALARKMKEMNRVFDIQGIAVIENIDGTFDVDMNIFQDDGYLSDGFTVHLELGDYITVYDEHSSYNI